MNNIEHSSDMQFSEFIASLVARLSVYLFSLFIIIALAIGWQQRNEYWVTPEHGIGYALGIIGGVMMLLMLLYPLRKNLKILSGVFQVKDWFRAHMILGILGPLLILFHCNFHLGSINSNVALFSMLLVVLSGLIGRYVYRQVHHGLYGSKLSFEELLGNYNAEKKLWNRLPVFSESISAELKALELQATQTNPSLLLQWRNIRAVSRSSKKILKRASRMIRLKKKKVSSSEWLELSNLKVRLQQEVVILKKISQLSFFNQMFSLWHLLHLPIFLMLVITAILHVIVVHMY